MTIKRQAKSWKAECLLANRKISELEAVINVLKPNSYSPDGKTEGIGKTKTPVIEEKSSITNDKPKELKKVEPQAPQEQSNTLEIEEEPEPTDTLKPKEKKEELKFSCPECSKEFNELNEGCCPFCDAELESAD